MISGYESVVNLTLRVGVDLRCLSVVVEKVREASEKEDETGRVAKDETPALSALARTRVIRVLDAMLMRSIQEGTKGTNNNRR